MTCVKQLEISTLFLLYDYAQIIITFIITANSKYWHKAILMINPLFYRLEYIKYIRGIHIKMHARTFPMGIGWMVIDSFELVITGRTLIQPNSTVKTETWTDQPTCCKSNT